MVVRDRASRSVDIDDIRDDQIRIYGLSCVDVAYTFYHDETNNIRKLRLSECGLNIAEPSFFVLGGIVHEGAPRTIDISPLRNALRIQTSAHEIKLKHVAKGDFLEILKSENLAIFLRWISENGFQIHYHALDPIYWSIVDIIDSIISAPSNSHLLQFHAILKADLAILLRTNLAKTVNIFFRYNYPDLSPESRKPFIDELIRMLEYSDGLLPHFNAMMLKGVLQSGCNLPSLDFIEGFTPHSLIENFGISYLNRIAIFKYSQHILDIEESIRDEIEMMKPSSGGFPVTNYRFADSVKEVGIQISDIMAGLLGKMYTYFTINSRDDIAVDRNGLSGTSLKNAEFLRDLVDASHDSNIAFIHHVCSGYEIDKMNLFLRSRGSSYD